MAAKKSSKKPVIGIFVVVLIIALFLLFKQMGNKVTLSTEGLIGNTAGNLYNGGLFCEYEGRIYFSNPDDDYALYSMKDDLSDLKKLYNDYARYINVDENYVYYTRMNNKKTTQTQSKLVAYHTGIYRMSKTGKNLKAITTDPCGSLLLYDNKVYYQTYAKNNNKQLVIARSDIDGSNTVELITDDAPAVSVYEGNIYYSGKLRDQNVHEVNALGEDNVYMSTKAYMPIVTKEGTYYVSTMDGYKLYLTGADGSSEILVEKPVSWYNLTEDGRYIFYSCDEKDTPAIYMLDRSNGATEKISAGNFKWINIAGGYCFFFDFSSERAYAYDYEKKVLNFFNPSALK